MASRTPGSSRAPVGQASMQRVQEPQPGLMAAVGSSSRRGHERPQHDPGAVAGGDQHRVLAVEADPGARGSLAVDVLVRIDEDAVGRVERAPELVELLAERGVAVAAGIAREAPAVLRELWPRPLGLGRPVAERRGDDAAGSALEEAFGVARDLRPRLS